MDDIQTVEEIEKGIFSDQSPKSDFPWKNLSIGIGVVVIVSLGIYFMASSSVKSSDYKSMDLSSNKKDESVAGASVEGPIGPPKGATPTKPAATPTPTTAPTAAPTAAPTSAPTSTPTPQPTATPTPTNTPTPTPTDTPTPTPADTPTPTPTE